MTSEIKISPRYDGLPFDCSDWMDIGQRLGASGKLEKAEFAYLRAVEREPRNAGALASLSGIYHRMKRYSEACAAAQKAIAANENDANACQEMGRAEAEGGDWEKAEYWYQRAANIDPLNQTVWINWGFLRLICGDITGSTERYERAVLLNPMNLDARWNLCLNQMAEGKPQAFQDYEMRHIIFGPHTPQNGKPMWTGREDLSGKRLLVFLEQGLGDSIMIARYATPLFEDLECQEVRFASGDKNALNLIACCDHVYLREVRPEDQIADYDYHVAGMSLPGIFGPTWHGAYLRPMGGVRTGFYAINSNKLKVGFGWRGNPSHNNDKYRSIPVEKMQPMMGLDMDLVPVCLHHDVSEKLPEPTLVPEISTPFRLAQCISELDCVVTVDTAIAHIAGAMGKPTLVLLPVNADWRWRRDGSTSTPWYPSMRLFRATKPLDWEAPIQQVKTALQEMIRERN